MPPTLFCDAPDNPDCDNFTLSINAPSFPFDVLIQLSPANGGDWDLEVYGPDGEFVDNSVRNPGLTETVILTNPASGTYIVAAVPFAPAPGNPSYSAGATVRDAFFIDGDENITYSNHQAPPGISEQASAEPSIGVNHKTGSVMYLAALDTIRVNFDDCSSPAKPSWKDVSFAVTSQATLDPILFCDSKTGRTVVSQLAGKESLMAFTDNDGNTWTPSQGSGINSGVDHQTVGGGRFAAPLTGGSPVYPHTVYYCSQDIALAECARSDNGGLTFGPAVPIYSLTDCGGLHGQVKVSPTDGTVYVPNKGCGGHQAVVVSENNGTTWQVRHIPGSNAGRNDPSVAVASDGTVYAGWGNGHDAEGVGAPMVAVSKDKGRTWSSPVDVGAQLGIKNTAFPAMVAGDGDRAAFTFMGSTTTGANALLGDSTWRGIWHLYVSHTYDGGLTWSTVNATPGDPVQRGQICQQGTGCAANRNLLDFMGATIDEKGRVLVGYADGCIDSCVIGGQNSATAKAVIARQVNGRRLFAAFDGPSVPAAPLVKAVGDALNPGQVVHLSWSSPDDRGSPITEYRIYRRTGAGDFGFLTSVATGVNEYTDTVDPAQTYSYRVTAVNGIGEGLHCGDIAVEPPPPLPAIPQPESVCVVPGKTVLTDGAGDATGGRPEHDVRKLSIAEPSELGPGKIMFVLKMASLASPPPDTTWPVIFQVPSGNNFFVRMATNPAGQVRFSFGAGTGVGPTVAGTTADPASGFSPDGTIRIVVPRSGIGNPALGGELTQFQTRIRVEAGAVALTPDNMPDNLARDGSHFVLGSENCNKPPLPVGDEATTSTNTPVTIDVLANDTDPDADTLTVTGVTDPFSGSVVNNGTSVTYTPDPDFEGDDLFDYEISGGHGNAAAARVAVTVVRAATNNSPNAANDTATAERDLPVEINVLANDSDPDGDPITVVGVTNPLHGSVAATADLISYTPDGGFIGTDTFDYTISDGQGGTDTATVTVTVVATDIFPWYDGVYHSSADTVMVVNTDSVPITARIQIANPTDGSAVDVSNSVGVGEVWSRQFLGVMGGPVKVTITRGAGVATIRSLWGLGNTENFEEVPGLRVSRASPTHYWPWFDGVNTRGRDWIHVINPNTNSANVTLRVGNEVVWSETVPAGENRFFRSSSFIGGPVVLTASQPVLASQRALWAGENFSEVPGIGLTADTWFSWYDYEGSGGNDWIVIGNPSDAAVSATVSIAGGSYGPFNVPANSSIAPTFPGVRGGPVHVTASGQVVVSQRAVWNGFSMEEIGGTDPISDGFFSFYDAVGSSNREWIVTANTGSEPAGVTIKIGGETVASFTVAPGGVDARVFSGRQGGPVEVIGSAGGKLVVSRRTLWGPRADFTEILPF